jgi:hypothetical protein
MLKVEEVAHKAMVTMLQPGMDQESFHIPVQNNKMQQQE